MDEEDDRDITSSLANAKQPSGLTRDGRRIAILGSIGLILIGLALALFIVPGQREIEKKAVIAKTRADKAATTAANTETTAQTARRRGKASEKKAEKAPLAAARRVIQYLQGQRGIPGVKGRDGIRGAPGPRGIAGLSGDDGQAGAKGEPGAQGLPGPPPTAAQIAQAARDACAAGLCNSITVEQVRDAVASLLGPVVKASLDEYCAAHDGCRGPKGDTGEKGTDGAAGANGADGAQGPVGPAGTTCPATAVVTQQDGTQVTVCTP